MSDLYELLEERKPGGKKYTPEEYKEYKRGQRDAAYSLIQQQTEEIIVNPKAFESYLQLQSRLDRYSVSNVLLILNQRPNASQLKDYQSWIVRGTSVNRGEKEISILEPYTYTKDDGTEGIGYNLKRVFDISQTTEKYRQPAKVHVNDRQILSALVDKSPVMILAEEDHICGNEAAVYDPEKQVIFMKRGLTPQVFFSNLAQKIAEVRLSMETRVNESSMNVLSAECIVYMLSQEFGFGKNEKPKCPIFPEGMEPQVVREELTRARLIYSQMKGEIYLTAEKELKAEKMER